MEITARRALTAALLVVGAAFLVLTFTLEPRSRPIPFAVGYTFEGLLLIQLARELRNPVAEPALHWRGVRWVLSLGAFTLLLGPLLGPTLFVPLYVRRIGNEPWLVVVAAGAATAFAFWLVTTRVLGAPIVLGPIGALVAPLSQVCP